MRIRTVDAFTDQPYSGNPAGVVLLDEADFPAGFPDDERLQQLAAELNLAETAFALRLREDTADWALRWFTPAVEVDLCGHATLATAHVLHQDGHAQERVRFRTRSGVLTADTTPDGSGHTLDFPTAVLALAEPPEGLRAALGAPVRRVHTTGDLGDLVAEVEDEATVRALSPDLAAVAALPCRGVAVTAEAGAGAEYDFVSRFFAPAQGVPEDPVTGSAHTALAPLWAERLGRTELVGLQCSRRTGLVRTEVLGGRTRLTGAAVTVLDAELRVPL